MEELQPEIREELLEAVKGKVAAAIIMQMLEMVLASKEDVENAKSGKEMAKRITETAADIVAVFEAVLASNQILVAAE